MENTAYFNDFKNDQENPKNACNKRTDSEKLYSFEEAVNLSETGKYHYYLFLISGLCLMEIFVENLCVGITMPLIRCDLHPTLPQESFLASANLIGIFFSSHAMGCLADTWGRLKTLRLSLIFCFITTVISAFSNNIWMLILLRLINGLFVSGLQAAVYSFVGEFHGQKTRVMYVTLVTVFIPFASIFLPAIAMGVLTMQTNIRIVGLEISPWRVFFLVISTLSLINICGLYFAPESPRFDLIQGNHEKALQTLRKLFKINTGEPESKYPVKNIYIDNSCSTLSWGKGVKDGFLLLWHQTAQLFCKERALYTTNVFCTLFAATCISQGTLLWFPSILHQLVSKPNAKEDYTVCQAMHSITFNIDNNATSSVDPCTSLTDVQEFKILFLVGAALAVLYLILVAVNQVIGQKNLLVSFLIILAFCALAIHWSTNFYIGVVLLTLIISIGVFDGFVNAIALEYYPTNINGTAMCLSMLMCSMGAATGGYIIGPALLSNCDLLFYIYFIIILILIILTKFLPYTKINKTTE